ncbi:hypothetical protein CYMTET_36151, partial [Cymbomonas tetramitiformis]
MRSPANASRRRHFVVGGGEGGEVYQVKNLGNPMMDGLEGKGLLDSVLHAYPRHTPILLLPGTRAPEAYANWDDLLESAKCIAEAPPLEAGGGWMFLAPTPHALPVAPFQQSLRAAGWYPQREDRRPATGTVDGKMQQGRASGSNRDSRQEDASLCSSQGWLVFTRRRVLRTLHKIALLLWQWPALPPS